MYSKQMCKIAKISVNERKMLVSMSTPVSVAKITKDTKIPRSTIAYTLPLLKDRGLVTCIPCGKRVLWQAIPESTLISGSKSAHSPIEIYLGQKEMERLWYKITDLPKGTRLSVLQPHRSFKMALQETAPAIAIEVSRKIKEKKFIVDAIEHQKSADILTSIYGRGKESKELSNAFMHRLEDIVKVPDDFLDETAEMYLYTDHIVFMDWNTKTSLLIHNKALYQLMQSMFQKLKAYGTRYHQGKYIEEISRL